MNFLLLAVAVGLTGAYPLDGSRLCQPHSRPWQVYLVYCSGALIDEWWLVTSFECSPQAFRTVASLGEYDVTVEDGTEQHIPVAAVIPHSPYRSPLHSLTMVRLAEPARFTQIQPIPLSARCPQPGQTCQVSGWGSTVPDQYEPRRQLKCITVPVTDDQTCMNTLPEYLYWSVGMVCAGQANTDNCLNNGGSVLVRDGQLQGVQWYRLGCSNATYPSVYTKLCLYNNWIKRVIDSYTPVLPTETTLADRWTMGRP
ncbi:LOW QUALITY PROTEIN: trypsinogen-like protein 3 [Aulostomus maculatus]